MTHFPRQNRGRLLSLIAAMLTSSRILFAQDQLPAAQLPTTDNVPVEGVTVEGVRSNEDAAVEPLAISQDAADSVRTFPPSTLEQATQADIIPADPQIENALPPFSADEMAEEDRDDLLRGPVHEAFAEQVNSDPTPNLIVTEQPPEAVEELPPALKPNGREVEWISGYWAWDEDQDDFIWISGVWREIPQGFRWLPGYWTEVEGGYQWISGTWVSTQTTEIEYLADAPPETLELGPVGVAPANDQIWIPGNWMWNENRYAWRPGYWSAGYDNWVWVPARYQSTPRGYYHCAGYWDYPVNRRGVLFAPSSFNRRFRNNRITRFTPRVVVSTDLLTTHFWVRPSYRHYYFGNYYDVAYANRGLTPWCQYPQQRRTFDPLFAYYSRGQRANVYQNQLNVQFNLFVNQPNRRPAITFRDQDRWQRDGGLNLRPNDLLGNRFQNLVDNSIQDRSGLQFVRLENRQREQVQEEARGLRELQNQRRDVERSLAQLQKIRDRELISPPQGNEVAPPGLRERLDRAVEPRVTNDDGPKSAKDENAGNDKKIDLDDNPLNKVDDSSDVRTLSGRREADNREQKADDVKASDLKANDVKDRDAKVRGTVADSLRLTPKAGPPKGGALRKEIENAAQDVSQSKENSKNRINQKVETAKEQASERTENAAARRIERTGAPDRLKLPPATRSIDTNPSPGVADTKKPSGVQDSGKVQNNRAESRVRSNIEGPVNGVIKNTPAIRNGAEVRERSRATDKPAENSPAIKRESTPRQTPAQRPPANERPAPIQRAPAVERQTPAQRPAAAERQAPAARTAPTRNQGGDGAARSTPNTSVPRVDSGARERSRPAPAVTPGRVSGGAGAGAGAGAAGAGGKRGRGK